MSKELEHEWQKVTRIRFSALSASDLFEVLRHPLCVADESHSAWMRVCGEEICKKKITELEALQKILQENVVSKSVLRRVKIMLGKEERNA